MSVLSDTELKAALGSAAAAAGLQVDQSFDDSALSSLAGPFVTREVAGADAAPTICVAVRDSMSGSSDELCSALTQAATDGVTGAEGLPVATAAELGARFAGPYQTVALTDGADIQALVLTAVERRVPSPAQPTPVVGTGALSESVVRAAGGFDKLINVALEVSVELGRTRVTLSEVLEFDVGSVVELDRAAGSPVDVRVNGTLLAQGEVVLIDDEYAVRITSIVEPGSEG